MNRMLVSFVLLCVTCVATMPSVADEASQKFPFRPNAQGVMKTSLPARQTNEGVSRHDVTEVLAVQPEVNWAKNVPFRRNIWTLKFDYKKLRMIWLDMPQASGKVQRKAIYYLVYSVTNVPIQDQKDPPQFGWMHPVEKELATKTTPSIWAAEYQDHPIRFIPEFVLESPEYGKAYPDRVIPLAMAPIRAREDRMLPRWVNPKTTVPRRTLLDSVAMTRKIPVGETFWGVAVWEEIDPRIDRFNIYIQGITNAYQWQDSPEAYKPGKKRSDYRKIFLKTLKLNFWRPGDKYEPNESEIRRGYRGDSDYEWLYLPSLSGK